MEDKKKYEGKHHEKKYEEKHHEKKYEEKHHEKKYEKHEKTKKLKKEVHNEEDVLKIKELEEALLKLKADNINYRKRKDEEVSRMLEFANEDIAKDILPIVDNFERAINLDDTNLEDELSKFLAGFKMIYCHLVDVLKKYEIEAIDGVNIPFDPTHHQGVLTEKVEGVEPGVVVEVLQKGYILKGKVIRPAMVKVSE